MGRNQKGEGKDTPQDRSDNKEWLEGQRDTVVLDTTSASVALIKNSIAYTAIQLKSRMVRIL